MKLSKRKMKIRRVCKQGKLQNRQRARFGLSGMPIIDRRSLSVKTKKDGVINVAAKLVGKPGIIISPKEKLLGKEVAITIQELASKKVIGPEALVKVQLKGLKLERAGGVWPPYMLKLEKGIVINVEKIKKI